MNAVFLVENNSKFRVDSAFGWRNCLGRFFESESEATEALRTSEWKELPSRLVRLSDAGREVFRLNPGGAE